jgi:hypothetical protein
MNRLLFAPIGIVLLFSCAEEAPEPPFLALSCEIALDYAENFTREIRGHDELRERRIALSATASFHILDGERLEALLDDEPLLRDHPDLPLIMQAIDFRHVSVLDQCDGLQEWALREDALTDEKEIGKLSLGREWPIVVLTMSLPAVSIDEGRALVYVSEYAGGLDGALLEVTYEKSAEGDWVMTEQNMLAIS